MLISPPSMPTRRQPGRQHPPCLLQQLEHVVGAVDLVDLAAARVADDDPRPVDPPGPAALLAHDPLGLVLGAEVRVGVEVFGLLEHVLGPGALVEAGGGDRADLVEAARLDRAGQFDRVSGSLDVGDLLGLGAGRHVVDRRQVEEVIDVAAQRQQVLLGDAETGLGEVAGDRHDPRPVGPPGGPQLLQAPARAGPDQRVDRALALQEPRDEVAADEAGRAGDEVVHRFFHTLNQRMAQTATVQIQMPEMGESVTEGIVLEWHVAEGDFVNEGDTVVEVSTDKVDAEVPAPADGVITKLIAQVDDEVPVGAPLAEMEPGEGSTRERARRARGSCRGGGRRPAGGGRPPQLRATRGRSGGTRRPAPTADDGRAGDPRRAAGS